MHSFVVRIALQQHVPIMILSSIGQIRYRAKFDWNPQARASPRSRILFGNTALALRQSDAESNGGNQTGCRFQRAAIVEGQE